VALSGPSVADAAMTQLSGASGCLSSTAAAAEGDCARTVRGLNEAQGIATSPDGRNVYMAGTPAEGGLVVFDRDAATGALTQKAGSAGCIVDRGNASPVASCAQGQLIGSGWGGGNSVTVSPDGRNVYMVSAEYGSISVFDRDQTTGALTQKSGSAGCIQQSDNTGRRPNDCAQNGRGMGAILQIVISPDGKNVYGATWSESLVVFDRDPTTGALTQKSGAAGCFRATTAQSCTAVTSPIGLTQTQNLVVSADGRHVYATSYTRGRIWLFSRDQTTGALSAVTCFEAVGGTGQCATHSGVAAFRGVNGGAENLNQIAQSPDGRTLYASATDGRGIAVLTRDTTTGYLAQAAGAAGCIADASAAGAAFTGCATARGMNLTFKAPTVAATAAYLPAEGHDGLLVFARDATTGALTQSAGADGCFAIATSALNDCTTAIGLDGATALALSPDAATLYVGAYTSRAVTTFNTGLPPAPSGETPAPSGTGEGGTAPGAQSAAVAADTAVVGKAAARRPRLREGRAPRLVGSSVIASCTADIALRACRAVVTVPSGAMKRGLRIRTDRVVIGRATVTSAEPRRSITVTVQLNAQGRALVGTLGAANAVTARVAVTATATTGGKASLRSSFRMTGTRVTESAVTG